MTSADRTDPISLRLPRLVLSRNVRFTNPFTESVCDQRPTALRGVSAGAWPGGPSTGFRSRSWRRSAPSAADRRLGPRREDPGSRGWRCTARARTAGSAPDRPATRVRGPARRLPRQYHHVPGRARLMADVLPLDSQPPHHLPVGIGAVPASDAVDPRPPLIRLRDREHGYCKSLYVCSPL